jgi:steroid delta-isomerase-like uncharacterized protein
MGSAGDPLAQAANHLPPLEEGDPMSLRALVEQHYRNLSTGNLDAEDDLFSPDLVHVDPAVGTIPGLDGFKAYVRAFHAAFPDERHTLSSLVESGGMVAAEGIFTGTHSGPLVGPAGQVPATGRTVRLPFADVFEVEQGRIKRHRLYYDQLSFLAQLGLLPAPAPAT